MSEWILLISMHLMAPEAAMRDISLEAFDGFKSKQSCEAAGSKIAHQLVLQVGKHRESVGIKSNTKDYAPSIRAECISVQK